MLKEPLQNFLVRPEEIKTRQGLPTGYSELDQFLLWQGLPKGAVSLFVGQPGHGATSLWGQTALSLTQQEKWAAWVNGPAQTLCPWDWWQKKMNFAKLVVVSAPDNRRKLLWALHELLALSLFDLIGCDLGDTQLSDIDVLKLTRHTRRMQSALVLMSANPFVRRSSFYSCILNFSQRQLKIERAQHRLTPHTLPRSNNYADFVPQLTQNRKALSC